MPTFPLLDRLALPATFVRFVPGDLHPDGRRYLPLLVFRLADGLELALVDRHHRVPAEQVGQRGALQIVSSLSQLRLQLDGARRQGFDAGLLTPGRAATAPAVYGQALAVPSWEAERGHLPYEYVYTELVLDIGGGTLGVRTAMTADDLAATIGKPQLAAGDWLAVSPSRLDVLGFRI